MKNLILFIPLLPFFGFLLNGLGRKVLSKGAVSVIGCGVVLASFVLSLVVYLRIDELSGTQLTHSARVIAEAGAGTLVAGGGEVRGCRANCAARAVNVVCTGPSCPTICDASSASRSALPPGGSMCSPSDGRELPRC